MENNLLPLSLMARRLGVETAWLRAEADAGRIPAVRAGKTFHFHPETVDRLLIDRAKGNAQGVSDGR